MATEVEVTIGGTSPDYASISLFEAGEQRNLVTADEICVGLLRAETYDVSALDFSGWTTDSTRYIVLRDDYNTVTYDGTPAPLPVIRHNSGTYGLRFFGHFTKLRGIAFTATATGSSPGIIYIDSTPAGNLEMFQCIIYELQSHTSAHLLRMWGASTTCDLYHCLFYNCRAGIIGGSGNYDRNLGLYNCTTYNMSSDGGTTAVVEAYSGTASNTFNIVMKNCLIHYSGTDYSLDENNSTDCAWTIVDCIFNDAPITNGISADTSTNNTESATFQAGTGGSGTRVMFTSLTASSEDFHLVSDAGNAAIDYGSFLSGVEAVDLDGDARPGSGSWDAGADETAAASGSDVGYLARKIMQRAYAHNLTR